MRRTIRLLAISALLVAMTEVSSGPALADHLDHDNDVFDDHGRIFDHDDDNFGRDGDDDDGGVICPDEDEEVELILGIGFVCVDEDDLDDLHFDHHDHHGFLD